MNVWLRLLLVVNHDIVIVCSSYWFMFMFRNRFNCLMALLSLYKHCTLTGVDGMVQQANRTVSCSKMSYQVVSGLLISLCLVLGLTGSLVWGQTPSE